MHCHYFTLVAGHQLNTGTCGEEKKLRQRRGNGFPGIYRDFSVQRYFLDWWLKEGRHFDMEFSSDGTVIFSFEIEPSGVNYCHQQTNELWPQQIHPSWGLMMVGGPGRWRSQGHVVSKTTCGFYWKCHQLDNKKQPTSKRESQTGWGYD